MSWHPGRTIKDLEKEAIEQAMTFYQGNKTHTANSLGICVNTLNARLAEYAGTEIGNGKEKGTESEKPNSNVESGVPVESTLKIPPKQQMPMRKRAEI